MSINYYYIMLHTYALLFLLLTVNDISSDMNVQVQPIIGAVPGGGEAKQYFIVCEHKPLFKISSFRSGLFSCSQHIIVLIYPWQARNVFYFLQDLNVILPNSIIFCSITS